MNVSFTPQARDDLTVICDWIAEDNARAAERVVARIAQTALMFGQFPLLGRAGQVAGTREFSVVGLPYVIVYAITSESEIDILTVLHMRRLSFHYHDGLLRSRPENSSRESMILGAPYLDLKALRCA